MSECPYLSFSESKSCANCTGYRCVAYGRAKKLTDVALCKEGYRECPRYVDAAGVKVEEPKVFTTNTGNFDTTTVKVEVPPPPQVKAYIKSPCGCGEEIRLSNCPYQSTNPPPGMKPCTGVWCHANNKSVRVPKNCWNFQICTVYLMSKFKGVPFP